MGDRRCCCEGECWWWEDRFNREESTNIGSDWVEVRGDWDIKNAGTGDLCLSCPPPLNQLHERYGS